MTAALIRCSCCDAEAAAKGNRPVRCKLTCNRDDAAEAEDEFDVIADVIDITTV